MRLPVPCLVLAALIPVLMFAGCNKPTEEVDPVATVKFLDNITAMEEAKREAAIADSEERERATAVAAAERIGRVAEAH